MTKWLDKIWTDCGHHLKDLELKFMTSSIEIFSAVIGSTADFPAIFVLDRAIPILVELYRTKSTDSSSNCVSILRHISQLIKHAPSPVITPGKPHLFNWKIFQSLGIEPGVAQMKVTLEMP